MLFITQFVYLALLSTQQEFLFQPNARRPRIFGGRKCLLPPHFFLPQGGVVVRLGVRVSAYSFQLRQLGSSFFRLPRRSVRQFAVTQPAKRFVFAPRVYPRYRNPGGWTRALSFASRGSCRCCSQAAGRAPRSSARGRVAIVHRQPGVRFDLQLAIASVS